MKRPRPSDFVNLVWSIAHKMKRRLPNWIEVGDLAGAGMVGLIQATKTWKRGKGSKPKSYLGRRVAGAMIDYLRDLDHLSRSARAKLKKLEAEGQPLGRVGAHADPPRNLLVEDNAIADRRRTDPMVGMHARDVLDWISRHSGPRAALVFKLHFIDQRRQWEVADALGISESMISMIIRKTRARLLATVAA